MDKKEYIRIVVAGDLNPSEGNMELFEKGDSQRLFGREVCQLFEKADYSIVNLEGPLTDSSIPQLKDGPHIKAPISSFPGIRNLGVKCVALANNHITDYSQRGCIDTLGVLDSSGISHVGLVMGGGKK